MVCNRGLLSETRATVSSIGSTHFSRFCHQQVRLSRIGGGFMFVLGPRERERADRSAVDRNLWIEHWTNGPSCMVCAKWAAESYSPSGAINSISGLNECSTGRANGQVRVQSAWIGLCQSEVSLCQGNCQLLPNRQLLRRALQLQSSRVELPICSWNGRRLQLGWRGRDALTATAGPRRERRRQVGI